MTSVVESAILDATENLSNMQVCLHVCDMYTWAISKGSNSQFTLCS